MADQTIARSINERSILTLLRLRGSLSRAGIARELSLTPATITRLVADMAKNGLVREIGHGPAKAQAREPGRPGVQVALDPRGSYFLGIEIGVGVLRLAIVDFAAQLARSEEHPVPSRASPQDVVRLIGERIHALEADPFFAGRVRAAGVTVPGLVAHGGQVVNLPILGWSQVDLLLLLAKVTPLSVTVENNANAAAFGALYAQPSLPTVCTLFLKLGVGCGGAAVVNGRLLRGAHGTGMEVGHLRVSEQGPRCHCGQSGCLETRVNVAALARAARGRDDLDAAELARLPAEVAAEAKQGNGRSKAAIEHLSHHLGLGLVSLVNLFNPTMIVLGGLMRPLLVMTLPHLREIVADRIIPGTITPDILLSPLDEKECAIGAACLAHHRVFDPASLDVAPSIPRAGLTIA
ncbi:ROK family protein [Rubellimicrobium rubrum]|uniref:ROK family protein n=1 Tax=Rubellimicrobium rubrum TaxID=2585369 RepID=A0A5C4MZS3_9RHOB|nr:ROK family transcriptional regulator [Rubellimicrobium rubrum]TNC50430.1 ROK family protein [Rubellimicrobium rubrum]